VEGPELDADLPVFGDGGGVGGGGCRVAFGSGVRSGAAAAGQADEGGEAKQCAESELSHVPCFVGSIK
jgi:hypothetical protein